MLDVQQHNVMQFYLHCHMLQHRPTDMKYEVNLTYLLLRLTFPFNRAVMLCGLSANTATCNGLWTLLFLSLIALVSIEYLKSVSNVLTEIQYMF